MSTTLDILGTPKVESAMQVSVVQDTLAKALGVVSRAIQGRPAMPILGYVLVTTDGERLRLSATNLETTITAWIPARVLTEGTVCLQGSIVRETVGALPSGRDVSIDVKGNEVKVDCERVASNLKGADVAEFPAVALMDVEPALRLPAGELKRAIEQVVYAAAKDESRPVLAGVNLRIGDGKLRLSAADGYRLSIRESELAGPAPDVDVIIPAKAMIEVAKALGADDDQVEVLIAENRTLAGFRMPFDSRQPVYGEVLITTRLLEGTFPDLERVIPTNETTTVLVDRDTLQRAIKVASIFARDSADVVLFDITPGSADGLESGQMNVSAWSPHHGDNATVVPCKVSGEALAISFNAGYVREFLGSLKTVQVSMKFGGQLSSGLFDGGAEDEGIRHVIMPMHNQNRKQ